MKTIPTEVDQGSTRSEERLVIDTAPTLIHTALPDGSLDFFDRRGLSAPTVDNPENSDCGSNARACARSSTLPKGQG
jgi:hypothetical protein